MVAGRLVRGKAIKESKCFSECMHVRVYVDTMVESVSGSSVRMVLMSHLSLSLQ